MGTNEAKTFAGSRKHILDWLEHPDDLFGEIRKWLEPTDIILADKPDHYRPKSCRDSSESTLVDADTESCRDSSESTLVDADTEFLTSPQKQELKNWWLAHPDRGKLPTWDLVIKASTKASNGGETALVLVEAKAHAGEFSDKGKYKNLHASDNSDNNTDRIKKVLSDVNVRLSSSTNGSLCLSTEYYYQFGNRIAFAWKLASMGIPVGLIYLGFLGDIKISKTAFMNREGWMTTFRPCLEKCGFPEEKLGQAMYCGKSPFWLLSACLPIK